MISISLIQDDEIFRKLKDEWSDLLSKSRADNVFLTWEWLHTWWEHFKENKELFIISAREDGRLIGIAPLYIVKTRFFGIRPHRHVEFIGSVETSSDYLDFILYVDREKEILHAMLEAIIESSGSRWDVLNLISISDNSLTIDILKNYGEDRNLPMEIYERQKCPFIRLPSSLENYYKSLNSGTRLNFRHNKNKLFKEFPVTFEVIADTASTRDDFDRFVEMQRQRREEKKQGGGFNKTRKKYLLFHKEIVGIFAEKKWLYLALLKVENKAVAGQYNFLYKGKLYCYSVGFDPGWSKYRVGSVLLLLVIEDAIKRNLSEFDFLRGEEEYKFYWTKTHRDILNTSLWRSKAVYSKVKMERSLRRLVKNILPKNAGMRIYSKIFCRE